MGSSLEPRSPIPDRRIGCADTSPPPNNSIFDRPGQPSVWLRRDTSLRWPGGSHGGAPQISRPLGPASAVVYPSVSQDRPHLRPRTAASPPARSSSSWPTGSFACCTTLKAWLTSAFRQVTDWRTCQGIGSVSTAFASTNDGGSVLYGGTAMLTKSRSSTIVRRLNHGP